MTHLAIDHAQNGPAGRVDLKSRSILKFDRAPVLSAVAVASLLAACGGGGGGDGGTTPPVPVASPEVSARVLENSAATVSAYAADIDDAGRTLVVFAQQADDGRAHALKSALATPGALGQAPSVAAVTAVDSASAPYNGLGSFRVAMSPNGHAVAVWEVFAPCTVSTYFTDTTKTCNYVYTNRRLAGQDWEGPVLVGDSPGDDTPGTATAGDTGTVRAALINSRGDILLSLSGWQRTGTGGYGILAGAAWRAVGQSGFTSQVFSGVSVLSGSRALTLDSTGNMLLVANAAISGVSNVVAYRGSLTAGFGAQEMVDTVSTEAVLEGLWSGVNGQAVVLWRDTSSGGSVRMGSVIDAPSAAWSTQNLGTPAAQTIAGRSRGVVTDAGNFILYDLQNCSVLKRTSGSWQALANVAGGVCRSDTAYTAAVSRTGDVMAAIATTGEWMAYDGPTATVQQAFGLAAKDLLFGVPTASGGSLLVSENGIGAYVTANRYEVLPTATAPLGTATSAGQDNLWVVFAKLP